MTSEKQPTAEAILKISNLSLDYQGERGESTRALEDINLTIAEHDFVCVLGPSGCGKSTLLKILAGLLEPTAGTVSFRGSAAKGIDYRRAVIFQHPVMYPWLNTYDNVAFGPRVRGVAADEVTRRVDKYLDLVGLGDFADSKPYELSGGMQQRAALARELVNDPDMLFLDEPFGALDALTRIKMQQLIREIWHKADKTVFLITHDVDEALMLGTQVYVMSARPGRIVRTFETSFTEAALEGEEAAEDVRYSQEYLAMRREALALISE